MEAFLLSPLFKAVVLVGLYFTGWAVFVVRNLSQIREHLAHLNGQVGRHTEQIDACTAAISANRERFAVERESIAKEHRADRDVMRESVEASIERIVRGAFAEWTIEHWNRGAMK